MVNTFWRKSLPLPCVISHRCLGPSRRCLPYIGSLEKYTLSVTMYKARVFRQGKYVKNCIELDLGMCRYSATFLLTVKAGRYVCEVIRTQHIIIHLISQVRKQINNCTIYSGNVSTGLVHMKGKMLCEDC